MLDWPPKSLSPIASGIAHTMGDGQPRRGSARLQALGAAKGSFQIDSSEDFSGIVRGLYQIRCNLFHGGKRPGDVRDQKLVKTASLILEKWVGNFVGSWR